MTLLSTTDTVNNNSMDALTTDVRGRAQTEKRRAETCNTETVAACSSAGCGTAAAARSPRLKLDMALFTSPPAYVSPVASELDDNAMMRLGPEGAEPVLVKARELVVVKEIGRGAYGCVHAMRHPQTGYELAVKRARCSTGNEQRLLREHNTGMRSADCAHMVKYFGGLFCEGEAWFCMERMDASLKDLCDYLQDSGKRVPEAICQRFTRSTILGLQYMRRELKMVHRDIKPSNVLVNRDGVFKLCDYSISGELVNSVAKSINAGNEPYMAPERIDGPNRAAYGVKADIWSLGISIVEVATGEHPYAGKMSAFERVRLVVSAPSPTLPCYPSADVAGASRPRRWYSDEMRHFVDCCLKNDFNERWDCEQLLAHPWLKDPEDKRGKARTTKEIAGIIDAIHAQQNQLSEKVVENEFVFYYDDEAGAKTDHGWVVVDEDKC